MKRIFCLILTVILLLGTVSVAAAGDATEMSTIKELLNKEPLHPQITGYPTVDALLEEILAPYAEADTYTRVKAAYDWTIREVNYNWAPYSQNWAPAYDCFAITYDLDYTEGLQESLPFEVVNRSYHALTRFEGICYDYAALFAVMARYIGLESYVHTGYFVFEAGYGTGSGHHGWTEVILDGTSYIFDPQRDYRMSANGTAAIPYYYFGIAPAKAWRYTQETDANAARDAQFLSVTAARQASLSVVSTASGTVAAKDSYALGETVTLTSEQEVAAWLDWGMNCLSTEQSYSFVMTEPTTLRVVFAADRFADIDGQWYRDAAIAAAELGIVIGTDPFIFSGEEFMSRAMAVTVLYRLVKPTESAPAASYTDVPADAWYTEALNWGTAAGVVKGKSGGRFDPEAPVTREQFLTMLCRLAGATEEAELPYSDSADISDYAVTFVRQAQALGLLTGYQDGTLRPQVELNRAEAVTLLMRLVRLGEQ